MIDSSLGIQQSDRSGQPTLGIFGILVVDEKPREVTNSQALFSSLGARDPPIQPIFYRLSFIISH